MEETRTTHTKRNRTASTTMKAFLFRSWPLAHFLVVLLLLLHTHTRCAATMPPLQLGRTFLCFGARNHNEKLPLNPASPTPLENKNPNKYLWNVPAHYCAMTPFSIQNDPSRRSWKPFTGTITEKESFTLQLKPRPRLSKKQETTKAIKLEQ